MSDWLAAERKRHADTFGPMLGWHRCPRCNEIWPTADHKCATEADGGGR